MPDREADKQSRSNFMPLIMAHHLCQEQHCSNYQGGWCWQDEGLHWKISNYHLKQWVKEMADREAGVKGPPGWLATKIKAEGLARNKSESAAHYNARKQKLIPTPFTPLPQQSAALIIQYFYSQPPSVPPLLSVQPQASEAEPPRSSPPIEDNPKERVFAFWRWKAGRNTNPERQARFTGITESFTNEEFDLQGVKYYEKDYSKENFLGIPRGLLKGLTNDVRRFQAEQLEANGSKTETEGRGGNQQEQVESDRDSQPSNAELLMFTQIHLHPYIDPL